jgi:hypothetical protein
LKTPTTSNYANFPENCWCAQAQSEWIKRIHKAACPVIKELPQATRTHENVFMKATGVANFSWMSSPSFLRR